MTPTTDEMRNVYATGFVSPNPLYAVECVAAYDEFDAWLTAHDAEVREQAAQRIEKVLPFYTTRPTRLALRAAAATVRGV